MKKKKGLVERRGRTDPENKGGIGGGREGTQHRERGETKTKR